MVRALLLILVSFLAAGARGQDYTFTTFAGSPTASGSRDGTGAEARFFAPAGVTTDRAGNVYVSDENNGTIRKITPGGVVTTLAGLADTWGRADGTGSAARFGAASDLASDAAGNIYVADDGRIRRVTRRGEVTTLPLSFTNLRAMAVDDSGTFYVVDGNQVRQIAPNGADTTLVEVTEMWEPTGIAVDGKGVLYVSDDWNYVVHRIARDGSMTTLAGHAGQEGSGDGVGTDAYFAQPAGIATDRLGNVYVTDYNKIRKITPAGVVTRLAGSYYDVGNADGTGDDARFNDPRGITVDGDGNVYVAEPYNHTIRKITPAGVVTTLAGRPGSSELSLPSAVATDGDGNVYVADESNAIRRYTPDGVSSIVAGEPGKFGFVDGVRRAARFDHPSGLAVDGSGNVCVADSTNLTIRKITPAGVVFTYAGRAGEGGTSDGPVADARFEYPYAVAIDLFGNIIVADRYANTIRKISNDVVTTLAGTPDVAGSADGPGSAATFEMPSAVAADGRGNVYVADQVNNTVRKISWLGTVTTLAGKPGPQIDSAADGVGAAAHFFRPSGIAADADGNVFVADTGNNAIRRITPEGAVTTIAGTPQILGPEDGMGAVARFHDPKGIAVDGRGIVYVADSGNNAIRKGVPALADAATIDETVGTIGEPRQLDTTAFNATKWEWRIIRDPSASSARLSSATIRNPRFTPDVADVYIFELTASDGLRTSVTKVTLTAQPEIRRHPSPHR